MEQNKKCWNRSTKIQPTHLQQREKAIQWSEENLQHWCWNNWTATCKKNWLERDFTPFTKINPMWIRDLSVKYRLLKFLLLSCFSRVWLCATPQTAAHQAPPSLGFSSQEHWSGLLFPSPLHESEKSKWSCSVVSESSRPHGLQPTRLLRPWDFPGKSTGVGCHCLLQMSAIVW